MSKSEKVTLDTVLRHLPPTETQRYLLKRLDQKSLLAARAVNKLWQTLVDPLLEFHLELSDKTKKYVERFGENRPVKSVSATAFHGNYPKNGISVDAHMLRITVNVLDGDESFQEFRRRRKGSKEEVQKNIGLSQYNYRRLIQDFSCVKKLHIASLAVRSFPNPKILSKVHLPNVEEMIVTFFDGGFHKLVPFLRNQFRTLKSVNIANVAETRSDRPFVYSWIYGFIANHFKTLEDVTLIFPEGMMIDEEDDEDIDPDDPSSISMELRRDHRMPQRLYEAAKVKLEKLNLDKFILDMSMLEGSRESRYDMGLTILLNQTRLSELHLDNLHIKDLRLWTELKTLLEKVSETLVGLTLGGCFCSPASPPGRYSFNCAWLKNCKKLKEFEMVVCGVTIGSIADLPTESLRLLNLGYMLSLDQIEYVALNMINLESWILPQRGALVDNFVPKISVYLFEAILHLPKLTKINISAECSEKAKILDFVASEEGIRRCGHVCLMDDERNGNLSFHICRDTFFREHSNLKAWMETNRPDNHHHHHLRNEELIELLVRDLLANPRPHNILDLGFEGAESDDDEDAYFAIFDVMF